MCSQFIDNQGISIVIPLYNKEDTICTTLRHVFQQSVDVYEIIVVDDGSVDGSVSALAEFEDRITLIKQENQGPSAARNEGARHAKYETLAFLDADDLMESNFVEEHLNARQQYSDIKLSVNSFDVFEEDRLVRLERLSERFDHSFKSELFDAFDERLVVNIHSSGYCVDKKLFFDVGGFDEKLRCWEITDLLTRIALRAKSIVALDERLSRKVEDADNSQFERQKKNFAQYTYFCTKVLSLMPKMPIEARRHFFKEMSYYCVSIWEQRSLIKLIDTMEKVKRLDGSDRFFSVPFKMELIYRIVGPWVKLVHFKAVGKS